MSARKGAVILAGLALVLGLSLRTRSQQPPQPAPAQHDQMPGMDHEHMAGMDSNASSRTEHEAMNTMAHHHHMMGAHMRMTALRSPSPEDLPRADEVAKELREGIERYKDYRVALADGFKIFLPNVPLPEYHFTNYRNGFLEAFVFDPARPTSLLYKKTKDGYKLIGAMYTMPKGATEEQLNERVPLSVAQWHLHTNLCLPPKGQGARADWTKFGLAGSISSPEACTQAGGTFMPSIFGWMVHVYPFEDSREKVWGQ